MCKSILVLPFLLSFSYGDSASQTDWSGGPGVPGPVTDLGTEFYQDTGTSYYESGYLCLGNVLSQVPQGTTVTESFDVSSIFSIDINGDDAMDILCTADGGSDVVWWENATGSGDSWVLREIDPSFNGAQAVCSADINQDGYMDVVAGGDEYYVPWWENTDGSGTSWTEHVIDDWILNTNIVATEDINGDGFIDVVIGSNSSTNNGVSWWENCDGSGLNWIEHPIGSNCQKIQSLCIEDVNGDGFMDVVGVSNVDQEVSWWENSDGSGSSWTKHAICTGFLGAFSAATADINGDGHMDVILGALGGFENLTWWENSDGSGVSWVEHTVSIYNDSYWSVYSSDVNGDGHMDILGTLWDDNSIIWWENADGSGSNWIVHLVDSDFYAASHVISSDINGDGLLDVVGGSMSYNRISWWDLHEFASDGWLESSILDTECSPQWASLDWNSSVPGGTELYFQYRTSENPGQMGAWSDPIYTPCILSGLLDRYFQYRVSMGSTAPDTSPVLSDLTLNWDPVSISETSEPVPPSVSLLPVSPNPTSNSVFISFALPEPDFVRISIIDIAGRIVAETVETHYPHGYQTVQLDQDLPPGVYYCCMKATGFTGSRRFMVIE